MIPSLLTFTPIVTADMIEPIFTMITTTIGEMAPLGFTVLGAVVGIKIVPKIVHMFV